MRFPDEAPVTLKKREQLREQLARLHIDLAAVDEQAVRGSGPGGQNINKTHSGVLLRYRLDKELIIIRCTRERQHALNRFLALRQLAHEVEVRVSPETSLRLQQRARRRKQKDRRRRRAAAP
ncbi:MAG: peptide chain release factor-like protein [Myxococcales bacterium]|nr:peptide chain release factor-like protein [Myxococcota bacterium]MDW8281312.1 peptide chain release factor-like protein [Myxococcales bacterium]